MYGRSYLLKSLYIYLEFFVNPLHTGKCGENIYSIIYWWLTDDNSHKYLNKSYMCANYDDQHYTFCQ